MSLVDGLKGSGETYYLDVEVNVTRVENLPTQKVITWKSAVVNTSNITFLNPYSRSEFGVTKSVLSPKQTRPDQISLTVC